MLPDKGRLTIVFQDKSCFARTIIKTIEFFEECIVTEHTPQFDSLIDALAFLSGIPPPYGGIDMVTVEECSFERLRDVKWEQKMWHSLTESTLCPVTWQCVKHLAEKVVLE